jgi:hypothetical protein
VLSDGDGNPRGYFNSSGTFSITTSGSLGAKDTVLELKNTVASWLITSDTTSSGTQYFNAFRYSGTTIGQITGNNTATTYATTSDYRLKNTVVPMTGALAKVAQLKPVTYKWNADGSDGEGFIAHELAEVCPHAVTGEKDATRIEQYEISPAVAATYDEDGNELTAAVEAVMGEREVPQYQGIDVSFLVATLTAAIQELKAEVDSLKAQIQGA